ncbi:MAG: chromosomal replication initiator protein DnaA [Chitinivibrionales bacterium]
MLITDKSLSENTENSLWNRCLEFIKEQVGDHNYDTWFKKTKLSFNDKSDPEIIVPSKFFADFIEEHFMALIKKSLSREGLDTSTLSFRASASDFKIIKPTINKVLKQTAKKKGNNISFQFNRNYTFDQFVVADNNRVAYTAAMSVAEAPGKTSFNPLIIYGNIGTGKTHLLQSIGNLAEEEKTSDKIIYMSSKEFINEYFNAVKNEGTSLARTAKFNEADLLLIDDIQFLSKYTGVQKEFFRLFNNLEFKNIQIVLTSDKPPEKIKNMMSNIINRFHSGLITDIQPPGFQTRREIIKQKAEKEDIHLPESVLQFLAGQLKNDVRELEGTLIKLIAYKSFTGEEITIENIKEIFNDVLLRKQNRITIEDIQKMVAERFEIPPSRLRARTKRKDVFIPRSIAMYLCRKHTGESLRTIGIEFGGRNYSTVVHSYNKVEEALINQDEYYTTHVQQLSDLLC